MRSAMIAISLFIVLVSTGIAQQEGGSESASELDPAIVEKIEELGGKVMRVARNDPSLEVSFHLGRNRDGLRQHDASNPGDPKPPSLDGELVVLKGLEHLVSLHLGGTDVTDEGLSHLAGLTSLKRLHLEKTKVSDAGLAHLSKLENLRYLNLSQTGVSDSGLPQLEGLKNLRNLYLWQTKVTPNGVETLKKALSECDIDLGWEEPEEPEGTDKPEGAAESDA